MLIDSQSLKCCFRPRVDLSGVGTDLAYLTSSISFCDTGGCSMGATTEVGHLLECMGRRRQSCTHPMRNNGRTVALLSEKHMQMGGPLHYMCSSSGRQEWGGRAPKHHESRMKLWRPLPPRYSSWSASQSADHRLWYVHASKCFFGALGQ
jgi:hypothetical protein